MEKQGEVREDITPPEDEKLQKQGKMWPKEVKIEELDENHPVRRLIKKAEEKIRGQTTHLVILDEKTAE